MAGPSFELCLMQNLLGVLRCVSPSERDPKFQVSSSGLNIPGGASLHWIQLLPAAKGLLLTLGDLHSSPRSEARRRGASSET